MGEEHVFRFRVDLGTSPERSEGDFRGRERGEYPCTAAGVGTSVDGNLIVVGKMGR